jgi:hypothetical protein
MCASPAGQRGRQADGTPVVGSLGRRRLAGSMRAAGCWQRGIPLHTCDVLCCRHRAIAAALLSLHTCVSSTPALGELPPPRASPREGGALAALEHSHYTSEIFFGAVGALPDDESHCCVDCSPCRPAHVRQPPKGRIYRLQAAVAVQPDELQGRCPPPSCRAKVVPV